MLIRCNYCWLGLFKCLSEAFAFPWSGLCSSACLEASINTFWKGHLYNEDAHGLWPCLWWARHESALCNESLFITQGLMPHNPSDSYWRMENPGPRGSDCISHGKLQKHLKTLFLSHPCWKNQFTLVWTNLKSPLNGIHNSFDLYSRMHFWLKQEIQLENMGVLRLEGARLKSKRDLWCQLKRKVDSEVE